MLYGNMAFIYKEKDRNEFSLVNYFLHITRHDCKNCAAEINRWKE